MPDINKWLGMKYAGMQEARDIDRITANANAGLANANAELAGANTEFRRAETLEVAPNAASMRELQSTQGAANLSQARLNNTRAAVLPGLTTSEIGRNNAAAGFDTARKLGLDQERGFLDTAVSSSAFKSMFGYAGGTEEVPDPKGLVEFFQRAGLLGLGKAMGTATQQGGMPRKGEAVPRQQIEDAWRKRQQKQEPQGYAMGSSFVGPAVSDGYGGTISGLNGDGTSADRFLGPEVTDGTRYGTIRGLNGDGTSADRFLGPEVTDGTRYGTIRGLNGDGYARGTTRVPGRTGDPTVDKVDAKLVPGEAVLNVPAAEMMGRGLIAALNHLGRQKMGMT